MESLISLGVALTSVSIEGGRLSEPPTGITVSRNPRIISGMVRDSKGQPVVDARVYFIDGPVAVPDIAVLTDMTGRFSLSAPTAGMYTLQCTADGFVAASVTVDITSGHHAHVDIQLKY